MAKLNKKSKIDVSFLILNYNGKKLLKIALDSIKKLNFKGTYDVIIVDNNSTDGSQEFLRKNYPYAKLVENKENLGTSGTNSGLPFCKGKYIFFLNNDVELEKNCLKILYDFIEKDPKIGVVAPQSINYYNKKIRSGGYWISRSFYAGHYLSDGNDKIKEIPYAGLFLLRKGVVDKLGYLFDPDYFIYSEDLDFCLRTRLIGYKLFFVPKATIYHMHAATIGKQQSHKVIFYIERNLFSTFLKIFSIRTRLFLLPYILIMRLIAIAKDLVKFQFKSAFSRINALFWILTHLSLINKKRKKLQKLRKIKDEEILKLFSEKYLLKAQPPL